MQFVRIPPGSFMMGCSRGDSGCYPEEKPAHRVVITRAFEIGKYLVTQEEYAAIAGRNPSYFRAANLPVDSVSWEDARKFCEAFNGMQNGYRYRLPTEAEWEYAARGGSDAPQYGVLDEIAWSRSNSEGKTHAVGEKKPNGFEMHDTLGNLWEWVQDWYGLDYFGSSPESDPKGPESGEYRILRGGSWRGVARGPARVSSRYILRPGVRSNVLGFRCAREAVV